MKHKCFVLMPLAEGLREVSEHGIRPAAEAADFDCYRADDASEPTAIISDIIKNIFRADAVIADVSGSNPNVFYELGVAHTIANKTIIICEKTDRDLPFDLKPYRVIFYTRSIDGIEKELRRRLQKTLSDLPNWSLQLEERSRRGQA